MTDFNDDKNLSKEEKKEQLIAQIARVVIVIMNVNFTSQNIMTTQLTDNSASNRQFKSENIRFFNPELEIEENSIHVGDKI